FPCERWLAKSEDDGEIVRELVPSDIFTEKLMKDGTLKQIEEEVEDPLEVHTYKISVFTGDIYGAGTDANVFLNIYGDLGDTGERKLSKSETNFNKFERGQEDTFTIQAVDLGILYKIKIRHDNSMFSPDWFLEKVEILDETTEESFVFLCERWLSKKKEDKKIERTLYEQVRKARSLVPVKYETIVVTGFEKGAGTDANVFITIFGLNGDSGKRALKQKFRNLFERGKTNRFYLETLDMGELKKVRIEHDNSGLAPGWLVERVEI
ncbi:LOXH1 protein, partial [Spizaetus tyrannus]|nr:LOXH1 protein [Spizaetus tyrannus]